MYKNITRTLYFYSIITIYSFLFFYSSYVYLKGFYDPFYPTSCVPPEKILQSKSVVFLHAKIYYTYYPFSLIINTIFSVILNINCLDIGVFPFLLFAELLFFHSVLLYYTRSYSEKIIMLFLYTFLLISILHKNHPIFYITVGNTAYFLLIFLLFISSKRNSERFMYSDFILLFLLALLGILSYYSSGFSIITTFLLISIHRIFMNIRKRDLVVKSNIYWFVVLTVTLTYLSFDYMFYNHIKDVYMLTSIESLLNIFYKKTLIDPMAFKFNIPLWVSFMQSIYIYLTVILDVIFILAFFVRFFKNNVSFSQIILVSALISSFTLSLYYSFLMSTIYLRNYIFFLTIFIPLVFQSSKLRFLKLLVLSLITLIVLSCFISSMYYALNSERFLSYYTSYVRKDEFKNLCMFFEHTDKEVLYADLKTSFVLPIECNNPNILSTVFKTNYFSYYNETYNLLMPLENGLFLYTSRYTKNSIYLMGWHYYKPFIIYDNDFSGKLMDTGSIKIFKK